MHHLKIILTLLFEAAKTILKILFASVATVYALVAILQLQLAFLKITVLGYEIHDLYLVLICSSAAYLAMFAVYVSRIIRSFFTTIYYNGGK